MVFTFLGPAVEKCVALAPTAAEELETIAGMARGPEPTETLARHRTGWTAPVSLPRTGRCCLKVYHYPGLETLRGPLRTTFLCPSRARREVRVLTWLREQGLGAPPPLAWGEERRCGWLLRAWILTGHIDAPDLERLVADSEPEQRRRVATALGAWLARAHALGLEDRNPHLRNFLCRTRADGGLELYKLDSPKARIHRGPVPPRRRRRDLETIRRDGARVGLPWREFMAAYAS